DLVGGALAAPVAAFALRAAGLRHAGAPQAVEARSVLARSAAAIARRRAGLAAPRAHGARAADTARPGAARIDAVAARAALLMTRHEAALGRTADLEDQIRAARLPGQAGRVAQGDLVAEPEPPAARGAVVR